MQAILYQFPISHYCEKARWALDYKRVPYKVHNLLPGLHIKALKGLVADTTVPVLRMDGIYIQGSDQIIDALDKQSSARPLTPHDEQPLREAREWEEFAANKLGDPLRLLSYHYYLEHPRAVIDRFTENGPWYGRLFYALAFNRVRQRIRDGYRITDRTAGVAKHVIARSLRHLQRHLQNRQFLVGEVFSRADLSVCALLAPLVMPAEGYVRQGDFVPAELTGFRQEFEDSPVFTWVNDIYSGFRSTL
ncbi:MAG: hypothetical protein AMS22_00970 [Thiotrichales bacterium SG8_50]|nr:MAG: hypothetical protein AMS22_00970 [Thiotrichales bacterium SG8_50]